MNNKAITRTILSSLLAGTIAVASGCGVSTVSENSGLESAGVADALVQEEIYPDIKKEIEPVNSANDEDLKNEGSELVSEVSLLYDGIEVDWFSYAPETDIYFQPEIGHEYILSDDEKAILSKEQKNYSDNWSDIYTGDYEEINERVWLMLGQTQSYRIFGGEEGTLVETPDDTYLYENIWYTSTSMADCPEFYEADYDLDGEPELLCISSNYTGTEFFVQSAFVVDRNERGEYHYYHVLPQWYIHELCSHVACVKNENNELILKIDGEQKLDSYALQNYDYAVYAGRMNYIDSYQGKIRVKCLLMIEGDGMYMSSSPWPMVELLIDYHGAGQMDVVSCDVPEE